MARKAGWKMTPEARAKLSAALKGIKRGPTTRARQAEYMRSRWADPAFKEARKAAIKASMNEQGYKERLKAGLRPRGPDKSQRPPRAKVRLPPIKKHDIEAAVASARRLNEKAVHLAREERRRKEAA